MKLLQVLLFNTNYFIQHHSFAHSNVSKFGFLILIIDDDDDDDDGGCGGGGGDCIYYYIAMFAEFSFR